jgi:hypothetical protein
MLDGNHGTSAYKALGQANVTAEIYRTNLRKLPGPQIRVGGALAAFSALAVIGSAVGATLFAQRRRQAEDAKTPDVAPQTDQQNHETVDGRTVQGTARQIAAWQRR